MRLKFILYYFLLGQLPAATGVYILLREYLSWDMIPAYVISGIIASVIYLPFNKRLFKQ